MKDRYKGERERERIDENLRNVDHWLRLCHQFPLSISSELLSLDKLRLFDLTTLVLLWHYRELLPA